LSKSQGFQRSTDAVGNVLPLNHPAPQILVGLKYWWVIVGWQCATAQSPHASNTGGSLVLLALGNLGRTLLQCRSSASTNASTTKGW